MKKKVSVVLLSYNHEKFIRQTLESILQQKTNFEYEILCHDDASSDRTQDIILEYKEKYPNIIVPILEHDNKMSTNVNIITNFVYPFVQGEYIVYCDADDYWIDNNKLQFGVDFLDSNEDYSVCMHNIKLLYENSRNEEINSKTGEYERDLSVDEIIKWFTVPNIGSWMFRAKYAINRPELFIKIGGGHDSLMPISDYPLCIYLALNGKIRYYPYVMSVWRRHDKAWGVVAMNNKNRRIKFDSQKIEFYKKLDEYTSFNFNKIIRKTIDSVKFEYCFSYKDYNISYKEILNCNYSYKRKLTVMLGKLFPKLSNFLINFENKIHNKY